MYSPTDFIIFQHILSAELKMCFSKLPNSIFVLQEVPFEANKARILAGAGESAFSSVVNAIHEQLSLLRVLESPLAAVQLAMRYPTADAIKAAYYQTLRFAEAAYALFGLWDRADALVLDFISETCLRGDYAFGNNGAQNHKKLGASSAQLSRIYCLMESVLAIQDALYKYQVPNNISNYKRFRTQTNTQNDDDVYKLLSREPRYNYMFNYFGAVQMLHYAYRNTFKNDPSEFRIYAILSVGYAIFQQNQHIGAVLMSTAHALFYNEKDAGLCSARRRELTSCYVYALEAPTQFVTLEPVARDIVVAVVYNYAQAGKPIWQHQDCDKLLGKLFK